MTNTWLIFLGLLLIAFELVFGVISGFDLALIGLSFVVGGFIHYYSSSWQMGIIVFVMMLLAYFGYFRKLIKKKLLLQLQKIGIDSLLGKTAVVISPITRQKSGQVLLEGEVWQAIGQYNFKSGTEVLVEALDREILKVGYLEKL